MPFHHNFRHLENKKKAKKPKSPILSQKQEQCHLSCLPLPWMFGNCNSSLMSIQAWITGFHFPLTGVSRLKLGVCQGTRGALPRPLLQLKFAIPLQTRQQPKNCLLHRPCERHVHICESGIFCICLLLIAVSRTFFPHIKHGWKGVCVKQPPTVSSRNRLRREGGEGGNNQLDGNFQEEHLIYLEFFTSRRLIVYSSERMKRSFFFKPAIKSIQQLTMCE